MTKSEIVDKISRQSSIKKKEVLYIIDNFLEVIKESVKQADKVEIRGFGTFYKAERKAREIYSPIVEKKIEVPTKSIIAFKASKTTDIYKS